MACAWGRTLHQRTQGGARQQAPTTSADGRHTHTVRKRGNSFRATTQETNPTWVSNQGNDTHTHIHSTHMNGVRHVRERSHPLTLDQTFSVCVLLCVYTVRSIRVVCPSPPVIYMVVPSHFRPIYPAFCLLLLPFPLILLLLLVTFFDISSLPGIGFSRSIRKTHSLIILSITVIVPGLSPSQYYQHCYSLLPLLLLSSFFVSPATSLNSTCHTPLLIKTS